MSALVVDTSVWVEFLRGKPLPDLELALREGLVLLAPIVAAELLSAPLSQKRRDDLESLLGDLPLHPTPLGHWARVGALRARLARRGLTVPTPDAHVAQCALDVDGRLWSRDRVFAGIAAVTPLRLVA